MDRENAIIVKQVIEIDRTCVIRTGSMVIGNIPEDTNVVGDLGRIIQEA